jgi:hypothetical protein
VHVVQHAFPALRRLDGRPCGGRHTRLLLTGRRLRQRRVEVLLDQFDRHVIPAGQETSACFSPFSAPAVPQVHESETEFGKLLLASDRITPVGITAIGRE